MQFSPKLKKAAEEIKEILAKYDIAGTAILHTPGFSEFIVNINPSYSCAWIQGERFRMKALKKDYATEQEWRQKTQDTTNMMHHLAEDSGRIAMQFIELSKLVDKTVGADHQGDGGFTSQTTQNN